VFDQNLLGKGSSKILFSFLPKEPCQISGVVVSRRGLFAKRPTLLTGLRDKKDSITSQVKHDTTKPQNLLSKRMFIKKRGDEMNV
jgi:hypothetical protein